MKAKIDKLTAELHKNEKCGPPQIKRALRVTIKVLPVDLRLVLGLQGPKLPCSCWLHTLPRLRAS